MDLETRIMHDLLQTWARESEKKYQSLSPKIQQQLSIREYAEIYIMAELLTYKTRGRDE